MSRGDRMHHDRRMKAARLEDGARVGDAPNGRISGRRPLPAMLVLNVHLRKGNCH